MDASQIHILISVVVLLIIFVLVFFVKKNKKHEKLSPLASFAFVFIILSMFFDSRSIAYSLIVIGVILAVVDIFMKSKKRKK